MTRAAVLRDVAVGSGVGQYAIIQAVAPSLREELRSIDPGEIERAIVTFAQSPNSGLIIAVPPQSWCDPAGASPAQVKGSVLLGSECCVATGDSGCEAYTAIAWGVGLSHERSYIAGAECFYSPEGNMCGTVCEVTATIARNACDISRLVY